MTAPNGAVVLEPHHLEMLVQGSGIDPEVVAERGYRTIRWADDLTRLTFARPQRRTPGLLLPVRTPDDSHDLAVYRPDNPRSDKQGKVRKYETPKGAGLRIDVPPRCLPQLDDPRIPLWVTEGIKKSDALASRGLCAIALLGVWGFLVRNRHGGTTLAADLDYIALKGRVARIVFDSDVTTKFGVRQALERFRTHLQRKGAIVEIIYLPNGPDGSKIGVDDYLLEHTVAELEALAESPRPAPKAAAATYELLADAPPSLSRPLAIVKAQAYAATWLHVRVTTPESLNKHGEVLRHDPPLVETRRELFVVRDDGLVFGPGEPQGIADLPLEVTLANPPREERTWRARAVAAYRNGARPKLTHVFERVVRVYDTFIDFDRSLAAQQQMCELSACLSLATWFADAFTVLGYPWPNGERGSGKTHWLTCWARTAYLGEVLLSSGSFAALRDLADCGASLAFDDAEILSDPKKADPNKRELLLAGSRRGAAVPLKEPRADGRGWELRWANAYCPKAYSAIRLPDAVLGSRSLIVPLVRTADAARGNADPAEDRRWPCGRLQLQDDLWAVGVQFLATAATVWAELDQEVDAVGREFEPWRAVLAVARLVEEQGTAGLEERMRDVLKAYQQEKTNGLLETDWTLLVVSAVRAVSAASAVSGGVAAFSATHISDKVKELAEQEDADTDWPSPRRVGRILSKLRLKFERRNGKRWWSVAPEQITALMHAYAATPTT